MDAAAKKAPGRLRGLRRAVMAAFLVLVVLPACATMLLEQRLIYFPATGGVGPSPGEDVWLETSDGVRIHGWWMPSQAQGPAVLHLHGNAGNMDHRRQAYALLSEMGASVLAIDYRGYGRSDGRPSERGLCADARAAYAWLALRVPPERIVLYGESLGAGPACQLALEVQIGGLILQSAFTSIPDMVRQVIPWVPFPRLFVATRFDNLSKIPQIGAPKLLLHSRHDDVVPFSHGERLCRAAKPPVECFFVDGAGHNDPVLSPGGAFAEAVARFLSTL